MDYNNPKTYKNSLWKWILLYIIIAAVAYGAVYYFFFTKSGEYTYNTQSNDFQQTAPTVKNNQDLIYTSQSLDATNVDEIDSGLNDNDSDASAF